MDTVPPFFASRDDGEHIWGRASCDAKGITHPTLITESGRATVAYYSVLLFNILDVSRFETVPLPDKLPDDTSQNCPPPVAGSGPVTEPLLGTV